MVLAQFRAAGYEVVETPAEADICIVNTCSVTATAERKVRNTLRSMYRKSPNAEVLAIGCMAERTSETLAEFPGVIGVIGNSEKERIVEIFEEHSATESIGIEVGETSEATEWTDHLQLDGFLGRTRSFLYVQDGCSQFCTYCIVPKLRGRGRSQPISEAVDHARRLVDKGFKEIVLTGCALGTYGFDLEMKDGLARLLEALDRIDGLQRIRLGSVEPWAVTSDFLEVISGSDNICRHLHIPLQSCDDEVLRRMNRRYTVKDIGEILDCAYKLNDDWGFGSDIITGFPGETNEHFENTCSFLSDPRISYLHVFPFSERPGTAATRLAGNIEISVKQSRVQRLSNIDSNLRKQFREKHLGRTCQVLFENRYVDGLLAGHTQNYLDVYITPSPELIGRIVDVKITKLLSEGVECAFKEREQP